METERGCARDIIVRDSDAFRRVANPVYHIGALKKLVQSVPPPAKADRPVRVLGPEWKGVMDRLDNHRYRSWRWSRNALFESLKYVALKFDRTFYICIRDNKVWGVHTIAFRSFNDPLARFIEIPEDSPPGIRARLVGCLVNFSAPATAVLSDPSTPYEPSKVLGTTINAPMEASTWKHIHYMHEVRYLFKTLCRTRKVPDVDFIVNYKDRVILRRDGREPNLNVGNLPHQGPHIPRAMLPVLSFCTARGYLDIPIPPVDDIVRAFRLFTPRLDCKPPPNYARMPWDKRVPTAVFRGACTGCGVSVHDNARINLAHMDAAWSQSPGVPLLDAGLVDPFPRLKKLAGSRKIRVINVDHLSKTVSLKSFMTPEEQGAYKYAVYVEGNVLAYRLGGMFDSGSVVLYVNSEYQPWYFHLLRDGVNCVLVQRDLSNLRSKLLWLRQNDSQAQRIAEQGRRLAEVVLSKPDILDYVQSLLWGARCEK